MVKMGFEKAVFLALIFVSLLFLAFLYFESEYAKRPTFIFAYGGNLEKATFASRSGGFDNAAPAVLYGYRLEFETNKGTQFGVANIVKDENDSVPGAVYTLDRQEADALDADMGVPGFYGKISAKATLPDGTQVDVETHSLSGTPSLAPPSRPTVEAAAKGLQEFGYGQNESQQIIDAAARAKRD